MDKIDASDLEAMRAENALLRECVANLESFQERDAKEIELMQGQLEAMRAERDAGERGRSARFEKAFAETLTARVEELKAERDEWRQTAMNKLDVSNSTALQAMRAELDAALARAENLESAVLKLEKTCAAWAEVSQVNYQRAKAAEARVAELEAALRALVDLNEDYSPFGGEILQDRVERTWEIARAALSQEGWE